MTIKASETQSLTKPKLNSSFFMYYCIFVKYRAKDMELILLQSVAVYLFMVLIVRFCENKVQ